jgi:nicotinate-nucleotide adenylyltransferase
VKKIIIYGGAFNPPTNAHVAIGQAAADYAEELSGEFWILPSGERKDKTIGVSQRKRIAYCRALMKNIHTIVPKRLCYYEIQQIKSETTDTVTYLKQKYPEYMFIWLFGSDSIQTMPNWKNGNLLLEKLNMLIVQRNGYEIEIAENMSMLKVDVPIVSSTQVRSNLASGLSVKHLVPSQVLELL